MKLDIGAGKKKHKGYTSIDIEEYNNPDIVGDFRTMKFENIEVIRAHHLLEHFGRDDGEDVLKLWASWLQKGGILIVETPDFEMICRNWDKNHYWMTRHAYGSQEREWALHKDGWYEEKFRVLMPKYGLEIIDVYRDVCRRYLPNITVRAKKI